VAETKNIGDSSKLARQQIYLENMFLPIQLKPSLMYEFLEVDARTRSHEVHDLAIGEKAKNTPNSLTIPPLEFFDKWIHEWQTWFLMQFQAILLVISTLIKKYRQFRFKPDASV
jgi:hypothetical protein